MLLGRFQKSIMRLLNAQGSFGGGGVRGFQLEVSF